MTVYLLAAACYLAGLACLVVLLRAAKVRGRAEREADARTANHRDQHRRTR
ncbi:hypothetical protein ACFRCG_39670 [Embleya sp. NPDC056575]|uniref:hypothetical protein n=1 Tax=unclassified Embleya TaxID=2699296 RepID=UPI0036875C2E